MKKILICLLMLYSSASLAEPVCDYSGSQLEMNACAKRDYYEADRGLNKAYYLKMKSLSADERERLVKVQREWIKRRDARCKPKKDGGSNATIDHFTCLQTMTELRTLLLR